jgi:hypothetical protein
VDMQLAGELVRTRTPSCSNTPYSSHLAKGSTPMTVTIELTKGYTAIIDDEDADLAEFRWNAQVCPDGRVYARRTLAGSIRKGVLMHRVILSRKLGIELNRSQEVDHRDGNGLRNVRSNLRLATTTQNQRNRGLQRNNTTGVTGVYWHNQNSKWSVNIAINGKRKYLGSFNDFDEAVATRREAEVKYFGEFIFVLSRGHSEHALADLRAPGGLGAIVDEIRRVSPLAISSL